MVVWPGATWATADVARGWANGLQSAGVEVVRFRLDHRIRWFTDRLTDEEMADPAMMPKVRRMASESLAGALYEFRPDLLLVVDGKDIPPEVWTGMRRRGQQIVLVHTESPYEDDRIGHMWWCADHHLVNDLPGVERLRHHTPNVAYSPQCYDPAVHHPGGYRTEHQVVFVGSGFKGRGDFLARVDWEKVGGLTLAGHWSKIAAGLPPPPELVRWVADLQEPLPNEAAADLYRTSKLGLNLYRTDFVDAGSGPGWALGPREVEMAACGLAFLRQARGEGDDLFPILPTFGTPEELSDLAVWWLAHDDAREEAAAAAQAAVADRTFDRHAASLLRRVGALTTT